MSVFGKPDYTKVDDERVPILRFDDCVTISGGYRRYSFGSVSGYSAYSGYLLDRILEQLERAKRNNHHLVWFNEQAVVISDPPTIPETPKFNLEVGQKVFVDSIFPEEHGVWVLDRKPYQGLSLVRPEVIGA